MLATRAEVQWGSGIAPEDLFESARNNSRDLTVVVNFVASLREINEDEHVAEGICHDAEPTNRNVGRFDHHRSTAFDEVDDRIVDRLHEPVRLIAMDDREHDLCVAVWQCEARLADDVVSPADVVSKPGGVEAMPLARSGTRTVTASTFLNMGVIRQV